MKDGREGHGYSKTEIYGRYDSMGEGMGQGGTEGTGLGWSRPVASFFSLCDHYVYLHVPHCNQFVRC